MINLPQSYPLSGQAAAVRQLAAARPVCLAWENEHALTFEVGDGPDRCLVKWAPAGCPLDLAAEAERRQVRCPASAPGGARADGLGMVAAEVASQVNARPRP
jgi:hypothetical protein